MKKSTREFASSVPAGVLLMGALLSGTGPTVVADEVAYARAMASAVRQAAERVLPSVVTIEIVGTISRPGGEVEQDAPTSGVIVDENGFVLASSIVVRSPAASILVVLADGSRFTANVVARDHHRDLVLLKIDADHPLIPITWAGDKNLRVGQTTIAVGRYGGDGSPLVSTGILSATGRLDGIAIQSDARVSPAFYGGPLIDLYGNVLGILIPAVAEGGAADATCWYDSGIAFAIPTDVVEQKLDRLRQGTDIKKGLIGIVAKSQDAIAAGTEIAAVRARSPAESAGIKAGDHVTRVDGTEVRRHQQIRQVLGRFDAGEVVRLTLERDGKEIEVDVELADSIPPLQPQRLGILVRQESVDATDDADVKTRVVVDAVLSDSPADGTLRPEDVLVRIEEADISETASLRRQMISAQPEEKLTIAFERDGETQSAEIQPASISGPFSGSVPEAWKAPDEQAWTVQELKIPDAANAAAYVGPSLEASPPQLGLLVLLLNPGDPQPREPLQSWSDAARDAGVVVCAVAAEDAGRWQPREVDVVAKIATAVMKRADIDDTAVAVAPVGILDSGKPQAADSMAIAVAISQSKTFFGVAVPSQARPPAIRLRENEASASLQIFVPIRSDEELPTWGAVIESAGYPIVRGGQPDRATLLDWVRLLQSI